MSPGIFITGTDTDVGKTIITAGIALLLKSTGLTVGILKPVQSGYSHSDPDGDCARLKELAGISESLEDIAPYRLATPVTPSLAAEIEDVTIEIDPILYRLRELEKKYDVVLVEGAGGFMVPMGDDWMIAHLAQIIQYPILTVARAGLGTINHSILTLLAIQQFGLHPLGIICNGYKTDDPDPSLEQNAHLIEKFTEIPVLGKIPWIQSITSERLLSTFQKHILLDPLLEQI